MEFCGIAAASGYGIGKAFLLQEAELKIEKKTLSSEQTAAEITRLETSLAEAIAEIEEVKESSRAKLGDEAAEIFGAHIMLLQDPEYTNGIKGKISAELVNAEVAVQQVTQQFLDLFGSIDDEYLRERAADLKDVSNRLLRKLLGIQSVSLSEISGNVIICAHDLTPSDTAQLDKDKVGAFVTNVGGRTSHSAIMARSMGIPAVVGLQDILSKVNAGDVMIVDGTEGKVFVNPSEALLKEYEQKQAQLTARRQEFKKLMHEPSVTKDDVRVELAANIGTPQDGRSAVEQGAEGVGLYRTEFLYMGRSNLPTEEEQFAAYKEVAELFGSKPVVIRTLDIGGDKELPYLDMPKELNPFLGYRAIRLCLDRTELFKTQLKAILRASAFGNIKIMYPMIATLQELKAANAILEEVKQELQSQGLAFNAALEVGIMVEIPSVAILADQFADEVDFFSIGTNDLVQYSLAVDRMNEKVSYLYQPFNPAVLRLVQNVIAAAHAKGKWVGMCGEMAGELAAIPILLGLGLDEFSMSASSVLPARALIRSLDMAAAKRIAQKALEMTNAEEIKQFVEQEVSMIAQLR